MSGRSKILFEDTVLLQAKLHRFCFTGAYLAAEGLLCAMEEDWKKAFYLAGKAEKCYRLADAAMREREHGKWHGFYANECLTDMKQTAWVLKGLMSDLRNTGDGPHFLSMAERFALCGGRSEGDADHEQYRVDRSGLREAPQACVRGFCKRLHCCGLWFFEYPRDRLPGVPHVPGEDVSE